jgi:hypothetical protein
MQWISFEMEFEVKGDRLIFSDIDMGSIEGGKVSFDMDNLRAMVIAHSRVSRKCPIEGRSMKELKADFQKSIDERADLKKNAQEIEIHNLHRIIESLEGQLADTTKDLNLTRKAYYEARAVQTGAGL